MCVVGVGMVVMVGNGGGLVTIFGSICCCSGVLLKYDLWQKNDRARMFYSSRRVMEETKL